MQWSLYHQAPNSFALQTHPPQMRHLFPPLRFPMAVYPGYPASPAQAFSPPLFRRSTGQTGSSKNCQGKRTVLKAFRSARYCGHGEQVGAYHRDEIRNIRARLEPSLHQSDRFPLLASGGEAAMVEMAPVKKAVPMCYTENTTFAGYACGVDASLSVPTGPENVPQHYLQPVALYLGRSAQV